MPSASSILGKCDECCECPSAEVVADVGYTRTCLSRTGSSTLCGYCGTDGWYYRRWAWSGKQKMRVWSELGCSGICHVSIEREYQGASFYPEDSCYVWYGPSTLQFREDVREPCGGPIQRSDMNGNYSPGTYIYGFYDGAVTSEWVDNVRIYTAVGCTPNSKNEVIFADMRITLSEPDTLFAAMQRGETVTGTDCVAYAGTDIRPCANPGLDTNHTVFDAQTVRVTFTFNGLPNSSHTITIRWDTFGLGNVPLPSVKTTLAVTLDPTGTAVVEVDIPTPTGAGQRRVFGWLWTDTYYLRFKVPRVRGGGCYRVNWVETNGTTETPKCAVWNGQVPAGYNPSIETTWPRLGPFTLEEPYREGVGSVRIVSTECNCTTC